MEEEEEAEEKDSIVIFTNNKNLSIIIDEYLLTDIYNEFG